MKVKEIKEKLDELKIEYDDDMKKDELEALLPEEPKEEPKEEVEEVKEEIKDEEEEVEEKPIKKEKKAYIYLSPRGSNEGEKLVRIYTQEMSDAKGVKDGKDFIEKAKGYAEKIGGRAVVK